MNIGGFTFVQTLLIIILAVVLGVVLYSGDGPGSFLANTTKEDFSDCPIMFRDDRKKWDVLTRKERQCLIRMGFNEDKWNCGGGSSPDDFLDWDDLPPKRQAAWKVRGYDKELWDHSPGACAKILRKSHSSKFNPKVIKLEVPRLQKLTMDRLADVFYDLEVPVIAGHPKEEKENHEYLGRFSVSEFIRRIKEGDNEFYMFVESNCKEKQIMKERIGHFVLDDLKSAASAHPELREHGIWKEEFDTDIERDDFDWGVFFGAKNTLTPTHYDSETFNFLYLVEGRKRVVIVPNDETTEGFFEEIDVNPGGGGASVHENILDPNLPLPEGAIEIILEAGEALHIPYLSWHAVVNLEPSLAYSLRVRS